MTLSSKPDQRTLKEPWCAYAQQEIRDDQGRNVVVYVEEGEPGFYETTYVGDFEYCKSVAASINETLGITPERAIEIVSSSMRVSNAGHTTPNRDEVLATVLTAEQALEWIVETTLKAEVVFTEENSEDRTLADYLADAARVLGRILENDGYDELVPAPYDRLATPGKVYDHDPRPDDMPEPGDRCRECGEDITWVGPDLYADWLHVDDVRNR